MPEAVRNPLYSIETKVTDRYGCRDPERGCQRHEENPCPRNLQRIPSLPSSFPPHGTQSKSQKNRCFENVTCPDKPRTLTVSGQMRGNNIRNHEDEDNRTTQHPQRSHEHPDKKIHSRPWVGFFGRGAIYFGQGQRKGPAPKGQSPRENRNKSDT